MKVRITELRTAIDAAESMLDALGKDEFECEVYDANVKMLKHLGFDVQETQKYGSRQTEINPFPATHYNDIVRFIEIFGRDE